MTFYPIATYGSIATIALAFVVHKTLESRFRHSGGSAAQNYRHRKFATTIVYLVAMVIVVALWSRLLEHKSTFFGIIGAGLAVALREPLLAIAGRIAIFAGHMYSVGDRVEINKMAGDVIDVGLFYTRMLEIGNWVHADQATGRIVQFSNSMIFGTPVFNYTQNFSYVWDEVILPVTYGSNIEKAKEILLAAADQYTKEFLNRAEEEMEQLGHSFLVPKIDLKPAVFTQVTDNYVNLTLRYIVDPKKRRMAKSFIFEHTLAMLRDHQDISFGSTTMDLTLHRGEPAEQPSKDEEQRRPDAA